MTRHLISLITRYRWPVTLIALATLVPATCAAAPAARIEFAAGNPVAISASGQTRALTKGVDVESGDTVNTNNGRVQLRFTDGAYVSLQPQSEFRIDDYHYDGKTDGSERGFFSLLKGGLRTITGLVGRANKKNYQVTTTVATIGIRGTEYTIGYTNSITGSVGEGEINVCTQAGCVPFGSGQSFIVTDANSRPQLTSQKTDLPPQQPQDPPPSFVAGNNVDATGNLVQLVLTGNQMLTAGLVSTGSISGLLVNNAVELNVNGAVTSMDLACDCSSRITFDGVDEFGNNGYVAWGRGFNVVPTSQLLSLPLDSVQLPFPLSPQSLSYTHYVAGLPALAADIDALALSRPVGVYTMIGNTTPTGSDSSGKFASGVLNSSSLTVYFKAGTVDWAASVTMAGVSMNMAAKAMGLNATTAGTTFSGGCVISGGLCSVAGGIFTSRATGAGVVYTGTAVNGNSAQGAVAYTLSPK
jgi:hypothetical protein